MSMIVPRDLSSISRPDMLPESSVGSRDEA